MELFFRLLLVCKQGTNIGLALGVTLLGLFAKGETAKTFWDLCLPHQCREIGEASWWVYKATSISVGVSQMFSVGELPRPGRLWGWCACRQSLTAVSQSLL